LKIANSDMPTTEKMAEIIKYDTRFKIEKLPLTKIVFEEESSLPKNFQKLTRERKRKYNKIIEDVYANGIKEGVFKSTPDLRIFVNAVLGMCSWVYKWYRPSNGDDPEKISQQFTDVLREGYIVSKKKDLDQEQEAIPPSPEVVELSDVDCKFEEIISKIQILISGTESLAKKSDDIRKLLEKAIPKQNGF